MSIFLFILQEISVKVLRKSPRLSHPSSPILALGIAKICFRLSKQYVRATGHVLEQKRLAQCASLFLLLLFASQITKYISSLRSKSTKCSRPQLVYFCSRKNRNMTPLQQDVASAAEHLLKQKPRAFARGFCFTSCCLSFQPFGGK